MGYILKPSTIDIATLTPIDNGKLTFTGAITELMSGRVVVVKGLEATEGADVYVKIDFSTPVPKTVITYTNPEKRDTYWAEEAVAINAFSKYDSYKYDATTHEFDTIYRPNDVVKYIDSNGRKLAGIVERLYKDSSGKIYIKFTDKDTIYLMEQSGQGMYGEDTGGKKPFIPVADTTKDGASVVIRDNKDALRVLM